MSEEPAIGPPQFEEAPVQTHVLQEPDGDVVVVTGRRTLGRVLERFGALIVLVVSAVVFSALRPQTFPTTVNLTSILLSQSMLALITMGLLTVLAVGEFDLSLGYVVDFCTMLFGVLTSYHNWNWFPAMVVTLIAGAASGVVNGVLVVRFRIHSFIATLGTGTVLSGVTIWLTNGQIIDEGLPKQVIWLGQENILGIGFPIYLMAIAVIIFAFLLRSTPFGRSLYAVGGGREVARLAGLRTERLIVTAFVLSGVMAAAAALVGIGLGGSAHPDVGDQYLLPAYAAAFLGATAIEPGRFNVWGTVVAILLLAVLVAGVQQLGAPYWVSPVFNGLALIVAVALARAREWKT
jgi:ribose transport system permease protein